MGAFGAQVLFRGLSVNGFLIIELSFVLLADLAFHCNDLLSKNPSDAVVSSICLNMDERTVFRISTGTAWSARSLTAAAISRAKGTSSAPAFTALWSSASAALWAEPRGDHIVDLARHTAETVGQRASLQLRRSVRAFQRVQNEPCDPITCPHNGIPSLIRLSLTLTFFNLFFDCIIVKKRQILNSLKRPLCAESGKFGVLSFPISLIHIISSFFSYFLAF